MSQKSKGITFGLLSIAIISMSIVLILALTKVYISNQIYQESREISIIEAEVTALKEESNILRMNVERLRYKNKITDTIFSMEENKEITDSVEAKESSGD